MASGESSPDAVSPLIDPCAYNPAGPFGMTRRRFVSVIVGAAVGVASGVGSLVKFAPSARAIVGDCSNVITQIPCAGCQALGGKGCTGLCMSTTSWCCWTENLNPATSTQSDCNTYLDSNNVLWAGYYECDCGGKGCVPDTVAAACDCTRIKANPCYCCCIECVQ